MKWLRFRTDNLPLRYQLVIHFLLISLLPAIILGVLIQFTVNQIITKQVNEQTLQLISKTNKSLESYVNEIQNMTYYISFHPTVQKFLESNEKLSTRESERQQYEIKSFLQGFTTLHAEVAGILVVNEHNRYLSNEFMAKQAVDLTKESWYQQAVANRGIFELIGKPEGRHIVSYAAYSDDEVVTVVRAILDPISQTTRGVILIDLKLRVIAETLKDLRLGKSGFLMLVDQKGQLVYAPNSPIIPYIDTNWFADENTGSLFKSVGNHELHFMHRKSNFTNWSVIGVFSKLETLQQVSEIRFYLICFIFLVTFLGVTASYFLSQSISRPILRLTQFMGKVKSGDLDIQSNETRNDEIGMLSQGFNQMLKQIRRLITLVEKKEKQKRESELRVLHANIKPHFIYNTLDTIQWLAKEKGAHEVSGLVDALSTFFRIGLSKGKEIISVLDEIEHVNCYLRIQQTRYSHKLNYEMQIDPHIYPCVVLKLILQPIVENAIYHGIKERRGMGHIRIEGRLIDGDVVIRVIDDGVGMYPSQLVELQQQLEDFTGEHFTFYEQDDEKKAYVDDLNPRGYGLMNVHARLKYSFGEPYGIYVESKIHEGTIVTIKHPFITDERRSIREHD